MVCLIPAAGAARRMGTNKLCLPFGESTVVQTTVAVARSAGCAVVLVTGCYRAEVEALFAAEVAPLGAGGKVAGGGLRLVHNPGWEAGMLGSIQAGLRGMAAADFLVMPADLPSVPLRVYEQVIAAADERRRRALPDPDRPMVPWCRGQRGHPVFVPASLIPAILELPPDHALRDFLETAGALCLRLDEPAIFQDLDAPADYNGKAARR